MPVPKPRVEIEFLQRVDAAYRAGRPIRDIAPGEGSATAGSLMNRVHRLGFRFTRDGGLRLVDSIMGRDLSDWLDSGELAAAPAEAEKVAA